MDLQKLDDFCAHAIRAMRGMASFTPVRDNGNAQRGREKAMHGFRRKLLKAFPELTEAQSWRLASWARDRARGWSFVSAARVALEEKN